MSLAITGTPDKAASARTVIPDACMFARKRKHDYVRPGIKVEYLSRGGRFDKFDLIRLGCQPRCVLGSRDSKVPIAAGFDRLD